ncbi:MAG: recombinase family protein [Ruminococcus sp.]|nr:recombinase family protein [Ruminococcus sp.]
MSINVAAYCRVSTDKEEQLSSLESQRRYFSAYIEQSEDWNLTEIYYDEGVSGTSTRHREGFQRMMNDVNAGKIQLIVTKEVSRFARNTVDTLSYTRELKQRGVGVLFINDNINTLDPDGELRLTIMASIAQEESRKTSERVKWGQKRRMEQGVVFGTSMLGYDIQNGKMKVNPEGAEIVRLIFHKYVNENKGTHIIARELLEAGILPYRVKTWSNTVILRVLRNEKYVGDLCQKKTYTPDYLTHSKKYNRGAEEKIWLRDHHEPIIDRDIWDRAQAILADRALSDDQKSRHSCRYWCSGKIVCGVCGERFISRTKHLTDASTYHAWRCAAAAKHGRAKLDSTGSQIGCDIPSVNDQVLLASVTYLLRQIPFDRPALLDSIRTELHAVLLKPGSASRTCTQRRNRLLEKKQRLLDCFLEGIILPQDYQRQNQLYDTQLLTLEQQATPDTTDPLRTIDTSIEYVKSVLDLRQADPQLCEAVTEQITVYPGRILKISLHHAAPVWLNYLTSGRGARYSVELIPCDPPPDK